MCALSLFGVPHLGELIHRSAVMEQLVGTPPCPTFIVAPSGYGKTCLAAQLAGRFCAAEWLDARGEVLDVELLAGLERSLDAQTPEARSTVPQRCLVLDDIDLGDDSQGLLGLTAFAQRLYGQGVAVLVTTRELPQGCYGALRSFRVLSVEDLRLSLEEAHEVAGLLRVERRDKDIEDVWRSCRGHAAILVTLLRADRNAVAPSGRHDDLPSLISYVLDRHASDDDRRVLRFAALLRRGTRAELQRLAGADAGVSLSRLAAALPLLRVDEEGDSQGPSDSSFTVHDLLAACVRSGVAGASSVDEFVLASAALAERGELVLSAQVIGSAGSDRALGFLRGWGWACLQQGGALALRSLFREAALSCVMGSHELLLLWSAALLDCDEIDEAHSRARASRVLAEHAGDLDAVAKASANCLVALRVLNRWEEARALLAGVAALAREGSVGVSARVALLAAASPQHILAGEFERAEELLRAGREVALEDDAQYDVREIDRLLVLLPCFRYGDFAATARLLAPHATRSQGTLSQTINARGNLAVALTEMGRLNRAASLFESVFRAAPFGSMTIYYLPLLGCVQFARGDEVTGMGSVAGGIRAAMDASSEAEAAQSRVFESMLLRALQRHEEALTSAERAYERLCVQDCIDFRRLAALEVAASLLALGDPAAARLWAETVAAAGFGENLHHAFRGAMVLALCDAADGDRTAAVDRLKSHASHVSTGNSNFQAAMYARAFPELLGLMAEAFGATSLPVHMLRMIPAQTAERALRASRGQLSQSEWDTLGKRLFGEPQFAVFQQRGDQPTCHVRLFGGFSVSVGDRDVQVREWRKRKARLLFAYLVARRGQEVAREQVFDLFWPDLTAEKAKNNFYVAWSAMKAALMGGPGVPGACPYVDNSGGRCRIAPESVRSDLDEFEEALREARAADSSDDPRKAIAAYERVASVYRGDLMPGDPYEDWLSSMRERYRYEFLGAMLRLTELLTARDDPCQALMYVRRAIEVDPQREDLYQAALRCHILAGQRSAAVDTFLACKNQLSEELGLDPSADTLALYQQILVMEDRPRLDDYGLNEPDVE